jgi:hypothetical protein
MLKHITEPTQGNIMIHDAYKTGSWEILPQYNGDAVYFEPNGTLYKVKIPYHWYYNTYDVWISISGEVEIFMVRASLGDDDMNFDIHQITMGALHGISNDVALKVKEIVQFEQKYAQYRR